MIRAILIIVAVAALSYGGYVYWQRTHPPAAPVIARQPRLAPPGVFFLLRYRSISSSSGVTGFPPGTQVRLVRHSGDTMHVTDGRVEFDAPSSELTSDLDIAARVASGDARAQDQVNRILASQANFISIIQATYGCAQRTYDVTAIVQSRVAAGERRIRAGNDLGGDPAFGCRKILSITYAVGGGQPITETVREGSSILLPPQPGPSLASDTPAPRAVPARTNPLDRPAYDHKRDVARPPVIRYVPRP